MNNLLIFCLGIFCGFVGTIILLEIICSLIINNEKK